MPGGVVPMQLMRWLRVFGEEKETKLDHSERSMGIATWIEREKTARNVADTIKARRKKGEGRWCHVDFGWEFGSAEKV
jgi:hypothetical protein